MRIVAVVLLAVVFLAPSASAQESPLDQVRAENARLRARVKILEARLNALEGLIEDHEVRLSTGTRGERPGLERQLKELSAAFHRQRARYQIAQQRLGKGHKLLKQYGNRLELFHELIVRHQPDRAQGTLKGLRELLATVEQAEVAAAQRKKNKKNKKNKNQNENPAANRARTHKIVRNAYKKTAERRGQKDERTRELGMFLRMMGEGFQGEWLLQQQDWAAESLGKEHEVVQAYAERLKKMQRHIDKGQAERAIVAFRAVRESLEMLKGALSEKKGLKKY